MAQNRPFSSQNTTLRIFDNSTSAQQSALNTLMTALAEPNLTDAEKQALYATAIAASGMVSALVDGVTGYGDTGEKTNITSAQLINRQGTYKDKGSVDAGEWSFDLLEIPADAGQILVNKAKADTTLNSNRLFVQTFTSSDDGTNVQRWYGIGMVTSITSSTAKDSFVPLKVTVAMQNGQVRSPVAITGI